MEITIREANDPKNVKQAVHLFVDMTNAPNTSYIAFLNLLQKSFRNQKSFILILIQTVLRLQFLIDRKNTKHFGTAYDRIQK
jgi:hypothetical protein